MGVPVVCPAHAEVCPVFAGVLERRAHKIQMIMAMQVVVSVDKGTCQSATALEADEVFRRRGW